MKVINSYLTHKGKRYSQMNKREKIDFSKKLKQIKEQK